MVIIYCTSSYVDYAKTAPGIGLVKSVDHSLGAYQYDYLPFSHPAPLDLLRHAFVPGDQLKLLAIRHSWLFEISSDSFRQVMQAVKLVGGYPARSHA